jgi:tRNA threonylcarbamoyl adenosine modification protein (Sua5/YciO/YrdC/YwlC family)
MRLKISDENPNERHIDRAQEALEAGSLIIYPTDTVYSVGCDVNNKDAIKRLASLVGKVSGRNFSLIFNDFSQIADYTLPFDRSIFKTMKKSLPGPYTFILKANNKVPKIFGEKKSEIGIRMPSNLIPRTIVDRLKRPLVTASLHAEDEILTYPTDPEAIHEQYKNDVALVLDGGNGDNQGSTVLSCLNGEMEILRTGKGDPAIIS